MDTLTELMPDLLVFRVLRPLLPFAGVLVGWRLGRGDGESARKLARLLSVALFAGFLAAAVTGWFRTRIFDSSIHQWVGQDLIASTSFAVPFAITLTIQQHVRQRPMATISQVVLFLFLLAVTFVVSLSGYLGPDRAVRDGRVLADATLNRFMILHIYFLPVLIPLLLVEWWWFFGARTPTGTGDPKMVGKGQDVTQEAKTEGPLVQST